MDESFKLSASQHERIYKEIEADVLGSSTPVANPRVIITGGQPGSGKSRLLESSKAEFPDGNVVVINGDDLRNYHSQRAKIFKLDDKLFAERTDADVRSWTRRVFEKAIESKRNIIFESTMREPEPLSGTMQRLKEQGYDITAKVVATHERTSTTSIFRRYEDQKAEKGYGRWSQLSSHRAGYDGLPRTVQHIEQNKLIDRIEIFNRGGTLLWRNELKNGEWIHPPKSVSVVEIEREREPTKAELEQLREDWRHIFERMDNRSAPPEQKNEAKSVYERLVLRELEKDRQPKKPSKLTRLLKEQKDKERFPGDELLQ
jgi:hypothetical protein